MIALLRAARRTEAFCASLNPGLCAVAIALALLTALSWAGRHPEMFQPEYVATASATGSAPDAPVVAPRSPAIARSVSVPPRDTDLVQEPAARFDVR